MAPGEKPFPRRLEFAAALLCTVAAFSTLAFILLNGVNVPFADEWWYGDLVKAVESGQASFLNFWSPNNEHRMVIPKLEFSTLAVLTHWNSKFIMIVTWLVVGILMIFLFAQFRKLRSRAHPILWVFIVGVSATALFSLVQIENWLWAYQFAFFFIQFTVVVSLFLLCRSSIPLWFRLPTVTVLSVAASFSSAQGLLLWPVLVLCLLLTADSRKSKVIGVLCLLMLAGVTFALYFHGLPHSGELQLRPAQIMAKPQLPLFGFLGLVGNPLAYWLSFEHRPRRAWIVGLSETIVFLLLIWIIIRRRKLPEAAPWLGLGIYAYLFCLVTTYGRLGLGYTGGFLASRYTTHVLLLSIAILGLLFVALDCPDQESIEYPLWLSRARVPLAFSFTFGIAALLIIGDIQAFRSGLIERRDRSLAKRLIPFFAYFDPEGDGTVTGPFYPLCPLRCMRIFGLGLRQLSEEGYFRPVHNVSFVDSGSKVTGSYSVAERPGEQRYLGIVEQGWTLSGTAAFAPGFSADLIFLRPSGRDSFIAATELRRVPHAETTGNCYYWRLFLTPFIFPDAAIPLEMWVYNREANAFVKVQQNSEPCDEGDNSKKQGN
jgi:hypothetical protein